MQVMILSHDRERGRVSLSTKKLEPTPGDMIRNPTLVFEKVIFFRSLIVVLLIVHLLLVQIHMFIWIREKNQVFLSLFDRQRRWPKLSDKELLKPKPWLVPTC